MKIIQRTEANKIEYFMRRILLILSWFLCVNAFALPSQEAIKFFNEKQYLKAIPLFEKRAETGDAKSQSYLATIYLNGLGVEKNFDLALNWASKSAVKNDPTGQAIMGYLYLHGYAGLVKDKIKALSYYQRAANQDNSLAIDQYAQILLQGHSKKDLDEIEKALIKDKSLSSSLVLMKLYSDGRYKPSNLYKSYQYALEAIKKGSSSPIWFIVENSNYLQFNNVLNAAWLKALSDLKNPDLVDLPNYDRDLKEAIESLGPNEIREIKTIKLSELINRTDIFLKQHQKKYGPIPAYNLINEGWDQFVGARGMVNEPLAQLLMEEGLKKAISLRQQELINIARNNLGVLFGAAVNLNIRNTRLAKVHIIDGADSRFGPDNLIWYAYEGKIDLPEEELKKLLDSYKELKEEDHIFKILGPLPSNLRNKPDLIIQYLIKKFNEKPNDQIAEQIADMYEDNYHDQVHLLEAKKWYEITAKMQGYDANLRLNRIEKILAGQYIKNMPDLRNSIDELFEIKISPGIFTAPQQASNPNKPSLGNRKILGYALVIGNSRYQSGRLTNPINDANLIATKLRGFGFDVTYVSELDRKSFLSTLINFSEKAKDGDVTIFYFAGHGMQLGGINYLLPIDIDFKSNEDNVAMNGISLNDLIRRNLPGKRRVIFLDACRTNPFKSKSNTFANYGLAPMNVPSGTLISFATKDGGVAFDGSDAKNSPYTSALAALINENEDIAILLRDVRDTVLKVTQGKQVPWEYGSLTGGKLILSNLGK